ncbi:MAG TPA: APC family permease [Gemmatimonadales bacterium]
MTAPGLVRVIGTGAFALTIINSIVGSGIFGLPAAAAAIMGPAAVLGYVGCSFLVGLVALCFAESGSRLPETGGTYAWSRAAFGPAVGASVGYLMAFPNLAGANAAVGALLVASLRAALPGVSPMVPAALVAVVYLSFALTNIRSVAAGAWTSATLVVIKLVPLLVLVVAGIGFIQTENLRWPTAPSAGTLGQGMVLLFFAFMGSEGPLSTIGEVRRPSRTIPRALALAVLGTGTLYLGVQLVAQGVLGPRLAQASDAPLAEAAAIVFGPVGRTFLLWAAIISTTGFISSDVLNGPRMLFALGNARLLPSIFGRVHPQFHTPYIAIVAYVLLCGGLAITGTFRQLAVFAAAGTLAIYLVSVLGLLRIRRLGLRATDAPFVVPGGPVVPVTAAVILVGLLASLTGQEVLATLGLAVAGLVVGLVRSRV